jgi:hypothetical protein
MSFHDQLVTLKNQNVTIFLVGRNDPSIGSLIEIGDDYVRLDNGPEGPHNARSLIPLAAISCVGTRT